MGLIDFVKSGVRELMVARPDAMKHLIVYKHPEGNIPTSARLTVDNDESAVFFKSGSPPRVLAFGPGRHALSTENVPFLNQFITSFTGGDIFQAEVFFVKSQPIRNLTFGGQMMSMRDPELDLRVTPRAYGTYAMVVVDPVRFITAYAGQAAQGDNEQITLWLRQRMFQGLGKTLAAFLKSGQTTFMDLGGVAPDLAAAMLRDCPDFSEIGVRVLEIGELKISVSDEDRARIDELQDQMASAKLHVRIAKVGIAGAEAEAAQRQFELDQRFQNDSRYVAELAGSYQGYAAGRAMIGAGEGMAQGGGSGGVVALGAQMAVGMGMAGMMQPSAGATPTVVSATTAATAAAGGGAGAVVVPGRVTCGACHAQVPAGKFCQECGQALSGPKSSVRHCTGCGQEMSGAKFCGNCGAAAS